MSVKFFYILKWDTLISWGLKFLNIDIQC